MYPVGLERTQPADLGSNSLFRSTNSLPSLGRRGLPQSVTTLNAQRRESTHRWPVFLPDGRRFLYMTGQQSRTSGWTVRVGSLDSDRVSDVIDAHSNAVYADGARIFVRNGTLLAQRVDERTLRISGDPVTLAENVLHDVVLGRGVFSASERGTLVYQTGSAVTTSRLVWLDRTGTEVGVVADACLCIWPRLSPDQARAAVAVTDASTGDMDISIYQLGDGQRQQLTFEESMEAQPAWTTNGSRVVFTSTRRGFRDIYWKDALGGGAQEPLLESDRDKFVQSVSDDRIVFVQGDGDFWLLPLQQGSRAERFPVSAGIELFGSISPDGRWFLYQSDEGGKNEVFVTSFPTRAGKWLISQGGGILPNGPPTAARSSI